MCWLIEQGKQYRAAFSLKSLYEDKRMAWFFSLLADDCSLTVTGDAIQIIGKKDVEEYFMADRDALQEDYPQAKISVAESEREILLLIKKNPNTEGILFMLDIIGL